MSGVLYTGVRVRQLVGRLRALAAELRGGLRGGRQAAPQQVHAHTRTQTRAHAHARTRTRTHTHAHAHRRTHAHTTRTRIQQDYTLLS